VDELTRLMAFNRWANLRLLDSVEQLSPEELHRDMKGSFASVLDTVVHMYQAEWIWLRRWKGEGFTDVPGEDGETPLETLLEWWDALWTEQQAFLGAVSEGDQDRRVHFRLRSGVEREQALGELIRHVVNHGTYHRGQLVTLLRQLGRTPPSTDYVQYLREMGV